MITPDYFSKNQSSLPLGVINIIFRKLNDKDRINLGVTCKRCWDHLQKDYNYNQARMNAFVRKARILDWEWSGLDTPVHNFYSFFGVTIDGEKNTLFFRECFMSLSPFLNAYESPAIKSVYIKRTVKRNFHFLTNPEYQHFPKLLKCTIQRLFIIKAWFKKNDLSMRSSFIKKLDAVIIKQIDLLALSKEKAQRLTNLMASTAKFHVKWWGYLWYPENLK